MKIISILAIIVFIAIISWSWMDYAQDRNSEVYRTYSGRIYLEGDEYNAFKQDLASRPEIEITKLTVLSSPNALIDFEFKAPANYEYQYGEVEIDYERYSDGARSAASSIIFVPLIAFFIWVLIKTGKVEYE